METYMYRIKKVRNNFCEMFYKICTESRSNSPTALKVGAEIGIDYERTTVLAL